MAGPGGSIGHAEIQIGDSRIMPADEFPEMNFRSPRAVGPVADQFYADRSASLEEPFGHVWHVATHVQNIPMKELKKRAAAMAASAGKGEPDKGESL